MQALQIGSVVAVLSASLALVAFLDSPFQPGVAGSRPTAMERTLVLLQEERAAVGDTAPPPCDDLGDAATAMIRPSAGSGSPRSRRWSCWPWLPWRPPGPATRPRSGTATRRSPPGARRRRGWSRPGPRARPAARSRLTSTPSPSGSTPTPRATASSRPSTGSGSATSSGPPSSAGSPRGRCRTPRRPRRPSRSPTTTPQALADADRLEAEAVAAGEKVKTDVERAERYVLAVVLFATAIALAGIGARLRLFPVRAAVLALGWAVFLWHARLGGHLPGEPVMGPRCMRRR